MTEPPRAPRRIGLFGGSFDPPHRGHRALADSALGALALDELRWVPAGAPWQKRERVLAAPQHRAAMVRLAIAGETRFVLDERELQRGGASYTVDTVRALQAEHPGATICVLIGQDQYARLATWHDWPALLQLAEFGVAARDGQPPQPDPALGGAPHRAHAVPMPRIDISSSAIRTLIAAGGDAGTLVAPSVARYIDQHRLYRRATD